MRNIASKYDIYLEEAFNLYSGQKDKSVVKVAEIIYNKYGLTVTFDSFRAGLNKRMLKKGKNRFDVKVISNDTTKETTERIEDDNGIKLLYKGGKPLQSKEDAIAYFEIDTDLYEIPTFRCNSWTTTMKLDNKQPIQVINYGVELKLAKKATEIALPNLQITKRKLSKSTTHTLNWGVAPLSDFHLGAYVGDLLKTQDFSFDIACKYLQEIATEINSYGFKKVYIPLLGDFIESFTGLNHINSWKGLHKGSYGMNAVILAHEILSEHLYTRVNNLEIVDFAAGNHDRITSDNKDDVFGEVANMLHYLFEKDFPTIESNFSSLLIKRKLDGIGYLGSHGHLGLAKKDTGKIVQDYGFADAEYHVVLLGHYHARETVRTMKKKIATYEDIKVVQHDSMDYRKITVSPLFTGNFYSESLGFSSTAGGEILFKNKHKKLTHVNLTL